MPDEDEMDIRTRDLDEIVLARRKEGYGNVTVEPTAAALAGAPAGYTLPADGIWRAGELIPMRLGEALDREDCEPVAELETPSFEREPVAGPETAQEEEKPTWQ